MSNSPASSWCPVSCGVAQGPIPGLITINLFISNPVDDAQKTLSKFTDKMDSWNTTDVKDFKDLVEQDLGCTEP